MADKPDKKPEAAQAAPAEKAGAAGLLAKTPVLLGGVMLLEAVVLFAGFKYLAGGRPPSAGATELSTSEHGEGHDGHDGHGEKSSGDRKKTAEVSVLDFEAPNHASGRSFLYKVSISVITKGEYREKVEERIKDHKALIQDRIRTIIAQSDPEKLGGGSEPGLETLRRQVKYQLDEIIGEGMIDEVLVPRCIGYRDEY